MVPIDYAIALGAVIFSIGLFGVLIRRNIVVLLMALELLLNGVNIIVAGFGSMMNPSRAAVFVIFIIMIAVSEAAVGFALILSYFRHRQTYDLEEINNLKG